MMTLRRRIVFGVCIVLYLYGVYAYIKQMDYHKWQNDEVAVVAKDVDYYKAAYKREKAAARDLRVIVKQLEGRIMVLEKHNQMKEGALEYYETSRMWVL